MKFVPRAGSRMSSAPTMAVFLLLGTFTPALAQRASATAHERPGWLPRQVTFSGGITAAQRATAMARLEEIERILLQIPALARPQGFEIVPYFSGGARQRGPLQREQPGNVIEYLLSLSFYSPSKAAAGEGIGCVSVTINPRAPLGSNSIRDERGRDIYIEQERGDPLPLATQVYGKLLESRVDRSGVSVLMTSGGDLPWKPVTREEFYDATILDIDGKDGQKLAEFRKALEKTPYQEWMEGAAERKKNREEAIATAAQLNGKAEADKMRKMMEDTEREVTEKLRASEAEDRERNKQALGMTNQMQDRIRAELEAMTPAERAMPAMIDGTLSEGPNATGWRMTARDVPPATWRVLTPDYDFWRARKSPVEVRSIMVSLSSTLGCLRPAAHHAVRQTWANLDWTALNRLLDVPR